MNFATLFYSGGKDSHYVLFKALRKGYKVPFLVNFEPLPHSDGEKYFNSLYDKKTIEVHSKLMKIPVCYYKFGGKRGKIFKDDRGFFLSDMLEFIKSRALCLGIKKIKILVPWISDDISVNPKTYKRYVMFKKIFEEKKADFDFVVENETTVSIIKKTLKNRIKSICVSVPKPIIKKKSKEHIDKIKSFLGAGIDMRFLKSWISEEMEIKREGGVLVRQDVHSMVISSPLFEKDVEIKKISVCEGNNIFSLKIFFV
ncbi:MAG: hypothetical protein ACP5SD_06890 [Elusimicrobiales bacterium]|nr:hypothetical protein [Elusimicrobiales bacterium]HOJ87322.1 hypothetical protein [Elusimicrobiales bacterium]HOL62109.1 hypothetical protein [Elusimicrobiales bacterium]HPO94696.1 hypothetical protein [Elusimicrobiales bacterium]